MKRENEPTPGLMEQEAVSLFQLLTDEQKVIYLARLQSLAEKQAPGPSGPETGDQTTL